MNGYEDFFKLSPNGSMIAGTILNQKNNDTIFMIKENKENIVVLENSNEVRVVSVILRRADTYALVLLFNFVANNKIYFYWINYYSELHNSKDVLNNLCRQQDVEFMFSDESLTVTKKINIPIDCIRNNLKKYRAVSQESINWSEMDFELLKNSIYNTYPSIEDFWNNFK